MDRQPIEVGIISASAIGVMESIKYLGFDKYYQAYALPLLIIFLLLIIFAKKMVSKI
jgi:hypothetical protein